MKITLISTSTYPSDQGLRTISSVLKKNKFNCEIIFLPEQEDYSMIYSKKVLNRILNLCKDSDIIGISAMVSTSIRAKQVIKYLKKLNKIIVWGGVHATICPQDCIKYVDIVLRGEGEEAFLELCRSIRNKKPIKKIKNLWIKDKDKIIKNDIRKWISNLDKLPFPDYDLEDHYILEKNKIVRFKERYLNGQIFFQTVRGCPNSCSYCSNHFYKMLYLKKGKIIRSHSINYVIKCLKELKNKFKSLGTIDFRAETFLIRPLEEIKEFCNKYKKEIGIRFKCLADPPTMDTEKIKLLINAGLTDIIIGIQSGSNKLNYEIYNRFISDGQVLKGAKILNKFKNRLAVMYDIITCNPYETRKDILATINLIRKLPKPFFLSVNNLVFFIGTQLYNKAIKDGIIRCKNDSAYNLNYWDRFQHIKLKKTNQYLTLVLNLMRGVTTNKMYGVIPSTILKNLLKKNVINFNEKCLVPTYFFGSIVQVADFIREKVAKRIYRSMPSEFKVWYDKVRYRV